MAASGIRLPRDIEKWLIWIVLAVFAYIIGTLFRANPGSIFPIWIQLALALALLLLMRSRVRCVVQGSRRCRRPGRHSRRRRRRRRRRVGA